MQALRVSEGVREEEVRRASEALVPLGQKGGPSGIRTRDLPPAKRALYR